MTISFEELSEAHSDYSKTPAKSPEKWKGVLDILNSNNWGCYEYLDWVYRTYRKPMVPSILSAPSVVEAFRQDRDTRISVNKNRAGWALNQVKVKLGNGYTIKDILADKELETFSLLLYLIAVTAKEDETAAGLKEAALYELRTIPETGEVYAVKFNRRYFPDDDK